MGGIRGKVKTIIMDKAPSADSLRMQSNLGFQSGGYTSLTEALNAEFEITLTEAEVEAQATVNDVVLLVESKVPNP